jgi:hypothetical protein
MQPNHSVCYQQDDEGIVAVTSSSSLIAPVLPNDYELRRGSALEHSLL